MTSTSSPFNVTTPADLLGYIPHALGFQPTESLVLLTMAGKRVGATLRLDLPSGAADRLDYAAGACSFLKSDTAADGVLLIMYTKQPWLVPGEPPFADLVQCLDFTLDAAGLALRDGWLVTDSTWRNYFCEDDTCCPWPGHPRQAIADSSLNTELVYRGSSYSESLEQAVDCLMPARWPNAGEVVRKCCRYTEHYDRLWCSPELFYDSLQLWDAILAVGGGTALSNPEISGYLLASLGSRTMRDAVLVLAALGAETAVAGARESGLVKGSGGDGSAALPDACRVFLDRSHSVAVYRAEGRIADVSAVPEGRAARDFGNVLVGGYDGKLDWERLDCAHALFSSLSAAAAGESRAALLCMLAWIEWARGRGSRAHIYLRESLKVAPDYNLAVLLSEVVGRGNLARWSRNRDYAWQDECRRSA